MNKRIKGIISSIIIACVSIGYFYEQNNRIDKEHITVKVEGLPKELSNIKIVQVSDLHLPQDKEYTKKVIENIESEKPDLIVMTGDIVDSTSKIEESGLKEFCKGIVKIAPVYAVKGNHEIRGGQGKKWDKIIESSGAKLVENKIEIFEKNSKKIAILGVGENGYFHKGNYKDYDKIENLPKILLSHRPERFHSYLQEEEGVDLVFTGHAHGGQVRIPFINKGIIAPNQGLFPKYTSGAYKYKNKTMVVSRGLGNSIPLPRFNNHVHLPVIILN